MTDGERDPAAEREQKGDELTERLGERFGSDAESESSKTGESAETATTAKSEQTSVKDRPSVLMYLPEGLHQELDIRFDELNARYKREHDEALEKNRDYYPAVVEAGLEGKDVEEILDI